MEIWALYGPKSVVLFSLSMVYIFWYPFVLRSSSETVAMKGEMKKDGASITNNGGAARKEKKNSKVSPRH